MFTSVEDAQTGLFLTGYITDEITATIVYLAAKLRIRGRTFWCALPRESGRSRATLVGRESINQPLSEGDLLRERVSNNIGQASDQGVSNMAISQHIVVSVPAGTEIYVVLQKAAKENVSTAELKIADRPSTGSPGGSPSIQELRQLLQLQRELNQGVSTASQ